MNNKPRSKASLKVINRLPRYYRYLSHIHKNTDRISSTELGWYIGLSPVLIRQDLSRYGSYGYAGYGYNTEILYKNLEEILGLTREYNMVIIGAGNLGQALCKYYNKSNYPLKVLALFDVNPRIIGFSVNDTEVYDIDYLQEFLKSNKVDIGIICIPSTYIQRICNELISGGIKGIWNFSTVEVEATEGIALENVNLSDSLMTLVYKLNNLRVDEDY